MLPSTVPATVAVRIPTECPRCGEPFPRWHLYLTWALPSQRPKTMVQVWLQCPVCDLDVDVTPGVL